MSQPFPNTALRRRYAKTVRDSTSNDKIDYILGIKGFPNLEGHQHPISGSKLTAILLKGLILPIGGASSGEGLRLQPAQQACLKEKQVAGEEINAGSTMILIICQKSKVKTSRKPKLKLKRRTKVRKGNNARTWSKPDEGIKRSFNAHNKRKFVEMK